MRGSRIPPCSAGPPRQPATVPSPPRSCSHATPSPSSPSPWATAPGSAPRSSSPLLDEAVLTRCRPVVIGDARRLREAARLLGLDCEIAAVDHPRDAEFTPGRVTVVDLGLLPADLPWGRSAVAGGAAYAYAERAAELAVAERCTPSAPRRSTRGPCTPRATSTPATPNSSPT
ncbi:hypothetical protein [Streptomyces sp. BRA346]|uniref:hypothetical protein n=1 Tax=Streptomyces sp. BRA346 TaxID=2878199 RepID=UPI00406454B9